MSEESGAGERAAAARVGAVAALLAASVLLSRVIGYVRDVALANRLGAGSEADAYYAAFQIPDILSYLLTGGALTIAFLPFYTKVRSERGEGAAERLVSTVSGSLAVVAVAATAALWLGAESLVALQFPRFEPETQALAVRLTRIVLPAQVFFITGGIFRAALMARGRFGAHALAPLVYNGCTIAGGLATGSAAGFAWGVLVGAIIGPWLIPLLDLRRRTAVGFRVAPLDVDFRAYLWIAAPLMIGLSLATVDEWYDRWFGALLGEGTVAHLSFARKLMQVPVAVVGSAIAAAALPALSQLWSDGRRAELDATLLRTLQGAIALSLLAAAACLSFAEPLVEVVYQHGRFTEADALRVSALLVVFAFAVPAWVTQQVAVRAFYARADTWRPMILGTLVALAAIPLYVLFSRRYGAQGLAAAGAIAMSVNACATLGWARIRHGAPAPGALVPGALRALAIALASGVASRLVQLGGAGASGALVDLALGGVVFGAVALAGTSLIGDPALRETVSRLRARLSRAR